MQLPVRGPVGEDEAGVPLLRIDVHEVVEEVIQIHQLEDHHHVAPVDGERLRHRPGPIRQGVEVERAVSLDEPRPVVLAIDLRAAVVVHSAAHPQKTVVPPGQIDAMHLDLDELEALRGRAGQLHVDGTLVGRDTPGREQGLDLGPERARLLVDAATAHVTDHRAEEQVGVGARRRAKRVHHFRRRPVSAPVPPVEGDLPGIVPVATGIERRLRKPLHLAPGRGVVHERLEQPHPLPAGEIGADVGVRVMGSSGLILVQGVRWTVPLAVPPDDAVSIQARVHVEAFPVRPIHGEPRGVIAVLGQGAPSERRARGAAFDPVAVGVEVLHVVQRCAEERHEPQDVAALRLRDGDAIGRREHGIPSTGHVVFRVEHVEVLEVGGGHGRGGALEARGVERRLHLGMIHEIVEVHEEVRALHGLDGIGGEPLGLEHVGGDVEVGFRVKGRRRSRERGNGREDDRREKCGRENRRDTRGLHASLQR